jgi:hypothetical protein
MKKLGILILLVVASSAWAQEDFQEELKLPVAHYSPAHKKIVVRVIPDDQNQENFRQQEVIINTVQTESTTPVVIQEITINNSSEN